jgi:hypothetical protein
MLEYTETIRSRYFKSSKKGKGKILDEFIQVTGLRWKAGIRLSNKKVDLWRVIDMVGGGYMELN